MNSAPQRLFVKLCGFTQVSDVQAASALDLDALGFVLAEDARVALDVDRLGQLLAACDARLMRVAVVGPKSREECRRILDLGFDAVQVVVTDWYAQALDGKLVIPVLFDSPQAGQRASQLEGSRATTTPTTDHHPLAGLICLDGPSGGGRGERPDWARAAQIARSFPLLLAGGLRADNVADALAVVRPRGVDVSSGVEAAPGLKDHAKMAAFVAAVRAAEGELC